MMDDSISILLKELQGLRKEQKDQGETLARVDVRTARTEADVKTLSERLETVEGQARAALARAGEAKSGTPWEILKRWPKQILAAGFLAASSIIGTSLALALLLGPADGLATMTRWVSAWMGAKP